MADEFDNTSFNIDEYAEAAIHAYVDSPENADDDDVVFAIAMHVYDGFEDDSESDSTFDDLQAYFSAAHAWCETVSEFDTAQEATFMRLGVEKLTRQLLDNADDLECLCEALVEIGESLGDDEKLESRLKAIGHDLTELAAFSDNEPANTAGIWSYDDDQKIVSDTNGNFVIEDRDDLVAVRPDNLACMSRFLAEGFCAVVVNEDGFVVKKVEATADALEDAVMNKNPSHHVIDLEEAVCRQGAQET
jgi:hypothetical protein